MIDGQDDLSTGCGGGGGGGGSTCLAVPPPLLLLLVVVLVPAMCNWTLFNTCSNGVGGCVGSKWRR